MSAQKIISALCVLVLTGCSYLDQQEKQIAELTQRVAELQSTLEVMTVRAQRAETEIAQWHEIAVDKFAKDLAAAELDERRAGLYYACSYFYFLFCPSEVRTFSELGGDMDPGLLSPYVWGVQLFRLIACALAAAIAYVAVKFFWKLLWLRFLAKDQTQLDELRCREEQVLKKTQALKEAEEQWAEKVLAAQAELERVREAEIVSRQRQAKAEADAEAARANEATAKSGTNKALIQLEETKAASVQIEKKNRQAELDLQHKTLRCRAIDGSLPKKATS